MSLWQRIKARLFAGPRPTVALGQSPIGTQSVWQQFTRIGGNLTPTDVSGIIQQADSCASKDRF